ncbi:amidase [Pseudoxanthomonas sp. JBR18]|uniref:amidase n=1 Tax=Pseudoxanthomonas sp. JBR18 TaxID=2969308 RepID=UPI002305DAA4|nr:amidase [Pseudoxanthomonas sp. JBR18]WCE02910.1 amidase [Pseudoxanthomonas sp. JBR18]
MRAWPALTLSCLLALSACSTPEPADSQASAPPTQFLYAEQSIAQLQARMEAGELDSRTLTRAYLDRIAQVDRSGPHLGAVLQLNPDAMTEAALRDRERAGGTVRGPLEGIPILLKDNIDATPMATTAGSLALRDFKPRQDAFLVKRLREAGAVILGKANLSEWANFRSSESISGWSGLGGQTHNPYALDRNPCGSSAGSAVAAAANLAAATVGTETDGSIICPASVNGVVGLKPTVGLVSRDGIVPISWSQDTAGPITRTVADAATLLGVMAGRDPADATTGYATLNAALDYQARLRPGGLKGARIGVLRSTFAFSPEVAKAMEGVVETLRQAGATVVDAQIPTAGQWDDDELFVLKTEFKNGLARYLTTHDAPVTSLQQLIGFNQQHAREEMPLFGQELFEQSAAMGGLNDPAYIQARSRIKRLAGPEGIDAALKAQHLDALVGAATGPAWRTDPAFKDPFPGAGYGAAAVAGYPSLTIPMGSTAQGLPLGVLFMGTAWSEARLIELGYDYEQRTQARKPPQYLPTIAMSASAAKP